MTKRIRRWFQQLDRRSVKQPDGLLSVLLNENAELGDRDDAALDLAEYDDSRVEQALLEVARSSTTDPVLADTVAASLAEVWCRKNKLDVAVLEQLQGSALKIAVTVIREKKPEWGTKISEAMRHLPTSHNS